MRNFFWTLLAIMILGFGVPKAQADRLVFFHSPSCFHCIMWREDNAAIYDKTDEGKRLPLHEVNLDQGMPNEFEHLLYPSFTPTFVVLNEDNEEVGRIVGYNNEFFWGFLQSYINELDVQKSVP